MEKVILNAFERTITNKKFKEEGFIAGVFYGGGVKEATTVKFEKVELMKILGKHGSNAKVWIKYGDDTKFGFVKEIQRHPVSAIINHIDVQLVSKGQEIKVQLPITFKGEDNIIDNLLQFNVYKSEIDVFGNMQLMPDGISIDVSQMKLGDTVTIKDFEIDPKIKITDNEDEVYAAVVQQKEVAEEEPTDEATAEEVTAEAEVEVEA